jgi:hypothetical protein
VFAGCVLVVSHDRMGSWTGSRRTSRLRGGLTRVFWFEGNYTEYDEDRKQRLGEAASQPHKDQVPASQPLVARTSAGRLAACGRSEGGGRRRTAWQGYRFSTTIIRTRALYARARRRPGPLRARPFGLGGGAGTCSHPCPKTGSRRRDRVTVRRPTDWINSELDALRSPALIVDFSLPRLFLHGPRPHGIPHSISAKPSPRSAGPRG